MKYIKSIATSLVLAGSLMATSCDPSDFGDINETPNNPQQTYTHMLFKYAGKYVRNFIMTSASYDPWPAEWSGYLAEAKNNQYGGLYTTYEFSPSSYYTVPIKNLTKMIELCKDESINQNPLVASFGSLNNQIAVATTLRAFFFMTLSDIQGPIVYSEALMGEENWYPKYDSQKDVYAGLDKELTEAFAMMDENSNLSSKDDYFFQGNISRWKKFNASLRMMMAIKLADVAPADGKSRFAKAFADGGMVDAKDSFTYTFDTSNYSWLYYNGYKGYGSRSKYFAPNKILVDALKEYKDPRLFTYATVGTDGRFAYLGNVTGADSKNFDDYKGIPHGLESNAAVGTAKKGACSAAPKYCEPTATYGVISAARTLLVEAEAAEYGWIDADPAELYAKGIQASFDFEAISDPYSSDTQMGFDPKWATEYIEAHPLPAEKNAAIREIVMQRFLAGFMMDGVESWSDWRRHNIPTMPMYKGQINAGNTSYPSRLAFSTNEYATNKENVNAAVKNDVTGPKGDNPWSRVWWDVTENECPIAQ